MVGALAWDLLAARRPSPIGTVAAAVAFFALVPLAAIPKIQGQCKLGAMIVIVLALLLLPAARGTIADPDPGPAPGPDPGPDSDADIDMSVRVPILRALHRV